MSDQQLKQITALALHEQGTTKGAAAEASLMANRFEMYGSKYGTGSAGLVNYVDYLDGLLMQQLIWQTLVLLHLLLIAR